MVYSNLGSTAAPLVNKPILTNKKNNKDKTNLNVNNLQVTSSLAKMVKKVVEESKTEEFTPSSSSICNRWTNVLSTSKDKSFEHTFMCNSDPEALIYVFDLQSEGGNSGMTVDMLPRQNNCSVCKDLDTCKNNIKDLYRPGLQKFCDSEEKLKKEVEYSGFNTDIYTYDNVCKKEFDPCYVPVADGADTDLDSAPISTPTSKPTKKVNEIDSEDMPEDNGLQIMIFLLLLLLIIASIVYKNLFK